jgi:hypothetical protein
MNCKECGAQMKRINFYVWVCSGEVITPLLGLKRKCSFRTSTNTSNRIRVMLETRKWDGKSSLMRVKSWGGNIVWRNAPTACPYKSPRDFKSPSGCV